MIHRNPEDVQERLRIDPGPDHQDQEGEKGRGLRKTHVPDPLVLRPGNLPVKNAVVHIKHIDHHEDDGQRGHGPDHLALDESP